MSLQRNSLTGNLLKLPSGNLAKECCCEDSGGGGSTSGCGDCSPALPAWFTVTFDGLEFDFAKFNGSHILTVWAIAACAAYTVDGYGCCRWDKVIPGTGDCESEETDWRISLTGSRNPSSPYDYRWLLVINYGGAACTTRWRITGLTQEEFCAGPSGSMPHYDCSDLGCPHRRVDASPPPSEDCRCNDTEAGGLPKCNCAEMNEAQTAVVS